MKELLFCNNCGKVRMSSVNKIGDKCLTCETGTFIGTGIDYGIADAEVTKEYNVSNIGGLDIQQTRKWMRSQQNGNVGVPKCPVCGSTNLKKITGTRKAMKIGLFGLFGAGDLGKTYQCGQCGAKF